MCYNPKWHSWISQKHMPDNGQASCLESKSMADKKLYRIIKISFYYFQNKAVQESDNCYVQCFICSQLKPLESKKKNDLINKDITMSLSAMFSFLLSGMFLIWSCMFLRLWGVLFGISRHNFGNVGMFLIQYHEVIFLFQAKKMQEWTEPLVPLHFTHKDTAHRFGQ